MLHSQTCRDKQKRHYALRLTTSLLLRSDRQERIAPAHPCIRAVGFPVIGRSSHSSDLAPVCVCVQEIQVAAQHHLLLQHIFNRSKLTLQLRTDYCIPDKNQPSLETYPFANMRNKSGRVNDVLTPIQQQPASTPRIFHLDDAEPRITCVPSSKTAAHRVARVASNKFRSPHSHANARRRLPSIVAPRACRCFLFKKILFF